jgi:hypothetical protein
MMKAICYAALLIPLLFWANGISVQSAERSNPRKPRIVYNDDGMKLYEAGLQNQIPVDEFLRRRLDTEVSKVPITTYAICVAIPDICKHDCKAGEVYGDRFGTDLDRANNPDSMRGNATAIRALRAKGTDVLRVFIDNLKPRGIEVLADVRMNDTHHRKNEFSEQRAGRFAIDHPEYVIKQPDGRVNETALDYSYPEVRAHRLAIMRELAEDYDIDGLELDFCRWAKFFPRDQGVEKAPIMTSYVGEIRQMLDQAARKRAKKRLTLGVRVPETLRTCWLAGLDVETWVRNGWMDYLAASTWNETDPQVPMEEFSRFTRGRCELLVLMSDQVGGVWTGPPKVKGRGPGQENVSYAGMLLTAPEARACAANYYAWGADGIFFWNVASDIGIRSDTEGKRRMWDWMNAVVDPNRVLIGPRRYHYFPLHKWAAWKTSPYAWHGQGQSPLGTMKTQILRFPPESVAQRQTYRFRMADGRNGEKLNGILRFPFYYIGAEHRVEIDINGRPVHPSKVKRTPCNAQELGLQGTWFEVALQDCPPFRGDNELGIILHSMARQAEAPYMEELDILVQGND